jgi:hypothetical protein
MLTVLGGLAEFKPELIRASPFERANAANQPNAAA